VFSGYERLEIDGVGEMEAFYSDGLRTLIETLPEVRAMGEKTLRWPGHVDAVRPLLADGRLVEEFRARCSEAPPDDLVVLLVRLAWAGRRERVTLVDRYDAATGLTAMARTTALTTSAVAQMVAAGLPVPAGVQPLERAARTTGVYEFIGAALARRGVRLGAPLPETPATAAMPPGRRT
jgi:saccharopine dehydrogenase-like NADP-dependent oxidoreductase